MSMRLRRVLFLTGLAGLIGCLLWGVSGLPDFGRYPGPYGDIIQRIAVVQTHATGIVSAVNFEYRGFDTVGEEFILFVAAVGVSMVLRHLRDETKGEPARETALHREAASVTEAVRLASLVMVGPVVVVGWFLASHAQTSPSGGFQGGLILATAFVLIYLAGEYLVLERLSPADLVDAVGAVGAGGFVAVGLAGVGLGLSYLTNFLGLGSVPGAVSSSGTIALISFFVTLEVCAAFVLIIGELLEQTLLVSRARA
jgi:multicomponent Na+:H+ antiporter subunit B